ncbi:hypothetical protein ACFP2T_03300 [Plantactinospora solaniradicis]|uniref:Nucleotidyltransferase AbiEii toxin of type IV toxin-antitoxin system n=1 Tax=Plantactinospora solaniradicis TaxID=1723736 RepID=A0ABW1K0W6_9ACTN
MTEPVPTQDGVREPLPVSVTSTSRASDAGYLTLADLSAIAAELEIDYRIVGGHMVTLLVAAYGVTDQVPMRETADADFAALPAVIADPRLPAALTNHGYLPQGAANRFVRGHADAYGPLELVVDILAPSYLGTLVPNQRYGDLVVDEVPGLLLALSRPGTAVDLRVRLASGGDLAMRLALPDLSSALCLKALAYRGRFAAKDATDLWRLLNAGYAAGLSESAWPGGITGRQAAQVLHRFFGTPGAAGLKQMSASSRDRTRMQALVRQLVARH